MNKVIIHIVGRDPNGVIGAIEVRCTYKGKHLEGFEDFEGLRNRLCLVLREWSKEILQKETKA